MTEQDRNTIIRLWENGVAARNIERLLPYKPYWVKLMIAKLRQNGTLKGQKSKTQEKTTAKLIEAFKGGITSPYDLAEMFGLTYNSVQQIFSKAKFKRGKPPKKFKPTKLCAKTNEIIEALKDGTKTNEIIKIHGVSRQYVNKIKNKYVGKQL